MGRGGKRIGAGRPKRQNSEPTKAVRLPISVINQLETKQSYELPLFGSKVAAGSPSSADDYIEARIDLNEHLVRHPASTFLVRAIGQSMINAGINENDILVVDRSIVPVNGKIVIASVDGHLTVKRLNKLPNGKLLLMPENENFQPIDISEGSEVHIFGVVTNVIHSL